MMVSGPSDLKPRQALAQRSGHSMAFGPLEESKFLEGKLICFLCKEEVSLKAETP